MKRLIILIFVLVVIAGAAFSQEGAADRGAGLTDSDFSSLRDRIRVRESELSWEGLPWLTTYHDGLEKAAEEGRPLVLWVMNGHPLGCT